jgi:hypothetical protein
MPSAVTRQLLNHRPNPDFFSFRAGVPDCNVRFVVIARAVRSSLATNLASVALPALRPATAELPARSRSLAELIVVVVISAVFQCNNCFWSKP